MADIFFPTSTNGSTVYDLSSVEHVYTAVELPLFANTTYIPLFEITGGATPPSIELTLFSNTSQINSLGAVSLSSPPNSEQIVGLPATPSTASTLQPSVSAGTAAVLLPLLSSTATALSPAVVNGAIIELPVLASTNSSYSLAPVIPREVIYLGTTQNTSDPKEFGVTPGTWMDIADSPLGHYQQFNVGDIINIRSITDTGASSLWGEVLQVSDPGADYFSYLIDKKSGTGGHFVAGTTVVNFGPSTGAGLVKLTSDEANAPFIDIATHNGDPWNSIDVKVRLGNLDGITDTTLNPSGYGLYGQNVFLSGKMIISNPGDINTSTLTNDAGWTDDTTANGNTNQLQAWMYPNTTLIDGGNIYTNTITANQIAAGTITANEIAANTITASQIATGAITADEIATGAITADKFLSPSGAVSSLNLITASTPITGATSGAASVYDGNKAAGSSYASFGNGSSNNNAAEGAYLQIDLTADKVIGESRLFFYSYDKRTYWYKIKYSRDGTNWYYAVGNQANNGWMTSVKPASGATGAMSPTVDRFNPPILARYIRVYGNGSTSNTGNHIYEWELHSNANTIIEGGQITTGTLNAAIVSVTNLNASNINTGTLNASIVNVTNLNASNITTGTLNADSATISAGSNSLTINSSGVTILAPYSTFGSIGEYTFNRETTTGSIVRLGGLYAISGQAQGTAVFPDTIAMQMVNNSGSQLASVKLSSEPAITVYTSDTNFRLANGGDINFYGTSGAGIKVSASNSIAAGLSPGMIDVDNGYKVNGTRGGIAVFFDSYTQIAGWWGNKGNTTLTNTTITLSDMGGVIPSNAYAVIIEFSVSCTASTSTNGAFFYVDGGSTQYMVEAFSRNGVYGTAHGAIKLVNGVIHGQIRSDSGVDVYVYARVVGYYL